MNDFQTSDKVVCVDDDWSKCWDDPRKWFSVLPVKGRVYVVEEVKLAKNGELMLVLVGCGSIPPHGGFYPSRFRLLTQNKAGLAATGQKQRERDGLSVQGDAPPSTKVPFVGGKEASPTGTPSPFQSLKPNMEPLNNPAECQPNSSKAA